MTEKPKILAISGSIRKTSSNLSLIKEICTMSADLWKIEIYEGLSLVPHFNPDNDDDTPPTAVVDFRNKLRQADGILICTPEYALGVPGTLKNAIDWTVSSMEFSKKPVALITAGSSGERAHSALLSTLLIIESKLTKNTQLVISSFKSKIRADGKVVHEETLSKLGKLIDGLHDLITAKDGTHSMPLLCSAGLDSGAGLL